MPNQLKLKKVVHCINEKFEKQEILFSGALLKETAPYIILVEDHSRFSMINPLYQYPLFLKEIENIIFSCLDEISGEKPLENQIEIFVSKASLYSPYHYLVTFL